MPDQGVLEGGLSGPVLPVFLNHALLEGHVLVHCWCTCSGKVVCYVAACTQGCSCSGSVCGAVAGGGGGALCASAARVLRCVLLPRGAPLSDMLGPCCVHRHAACCCACVALLLSKHASWGRPKCARTKPRAARQRDFHPTASHTPKPEAAPLQCVWMCLVLWVLQLHAPTHTYSCSLGH